MSPHEYNFLHCDYKVDETEKYLRAFVKSKYNNITTTQIFESLTIAFNIHAGHFRDNGDPFIIHPMRVALMLARFDDRVTSKVLIAALLHDAIEKNCLTEEEIAEKFGNYVAKLVQA